MKGIQDVWIGQRYQQGTTTLEGMRNEDLANPKALYSFLVVPSAYLGLQWSPTCSWLSEDSVDWLQREDWLNSAADGMSHLAQVTPESLKEQRDGASPAREAWTFAYMLMNTGLCVVEISPDMFTLQRFTWLGRGPSPCLYLVTGRHRYASKRSG